MTNQRDLTDRIAALDVIEPPPGWVERAFDRFRRETMIVKHGEDASKYGPGVSVELTGDEVALAIDAYLVAHNVTVSGSRTVTVNGELCKAGRVYVDPSGFVVTVGKLHSGRGPDFDR